jgi:Uma2 family endonuclease
MTDEAGGLMATERAHYRFTVDEYYHMLDSGILTEDDRVELIDGEILEMSPIGALHAVCVDRLNMMLTRALGDRFTVRVQNPIRLGEYRELQPDLTVLAPGDYSAGHPGPGDVLFLIEVADTTLAFDRLRKLPMYAAAGVGEAWLVDLQGGIIECHTGPGGGIYHNVVLAMRGETLESAVVPGLVLAMDDILG